MSRQHDAARATTYRGIVWRRSDFRETSRLITLLTADQGRVTTLGKGAHRPGSQCLGRIDFLNLLEVKTSASSTLPVLHRVRLVREHRRLREPARYAAASYVAEFFDPAFLPGRGDPGLFDLLTGGLLLLDRCPMPSIPAVLAGLEVKYLAELGILPPMDRCSRCGELDNRLYPGREVPGLFCARHAGADAPVSGIGARRWLESARRCSGRDLPSLAPLPVGSRQLLGGWIARAIDRRPRLRATAFEG